MSRLSIDSANALRLLRAPAKPGLAIALVLATSLASGVAYAESQAEIAARLNEEGKALMFANPPDYAGASAKFQDAHSRVPEPKYFFNHCTSLFQEGKFGEALTACNAADKNADDKLKPKIAKLDQRIREEAAKQHKDLQPVGGGGGPDTPPPGGGTPPPPVTGTPPAQPPYAVGRPPEASVYSAVAADNKYAWSLGIDLYGGGGRIGRAGYFGKATGGVRFKGDYIVNPPAKLGVQGYMQLTHFSPGSSMQPDGYYSLDVFDMGIAGYKHVCGSRSRLCFTPLIGAQLALYSPANDMDATGSQVFNYSAVGGRLEAGLSYALGSRYEHVLGLALGANVYTQALSEPSDGDTKESWGLDQGGRSIYVALGYTYRFSTPLGQAPFVTLE